MSPKDPSVILGSSAPIRVKENDTEDTSIEVRPAGFVVAGELSPSRSTIPRIWTHHVTIRRQKEMGGEPTRLSWIPKGIWVGRCTCSHKVQYWEFGATFGAMLYHQWKESF
jgi:hypothetical protein